MSEVACEGCRAKISSTAAVCPTCGRPTEHNARGCLVALAVAAAGCAAIALGLYELQASFRHH